MLVDGEDLDIEKGLRYKGEIFLFGSRRNFQRKSKELYATRIDRAELRPAVEPVLVARMPIQSRFSEGEFGYKFSRDSSKFVVFTRAGVSRRDPRNLGFNVFDSDLNLVWSESVTLPYADRQFELSDFVVDNEGNTYLLGKLYPPVRRVRWRAQERFEYRVAR